MNRIEQKFNELKKQHKTAYITYVTAGDPSIEQTEKLVYAMEDAGADIIEIGIPFSDPLADGPVIQDAAVRALTNGVTISKIMNCVVNIRKNTNIPLLYLVYFNTILNYGVKDFVAKCVEVGIDGLIIPDLPLEERKEIIEYISENNIALIPLVAPTSKERIKDVISGGNGFVYCVSSLGVTGTRQDFYSGIEEYLEDVKKQSNLPIAIGFGISDKSKVERFSKIVDGVIVGSAIVRVVEKTNGDVEAVKDKIKDILGIG